MRRGARAKGGLRARGQALIGALGRLVRDPVLPGVVALIALSLLDEYVWVGALLSELAFHVALLALMIALVFVLRKRFARALLCAACALFFAHSSLAQMRETRPTPLHGPILRVAQAHAVGRPPSAAQVGRLLASRNIDVLSLTGLGAGQAQRRAQGSAEYRVVIDDQEPSRLLLIKRSLGALARPQAGPLVRLGRCQVELVQVELPSLFAAARTSERKRGITRIAHSGREARRIYLGNFGSASDATDLRPLHASQELRDARLGHGRLATAPDRWGPWFGLPVDHVLLHGWILARDASSEEPLAPGMHRTLIVTLELTEPRCAAR